MIGELCNLKRPKTIASFFLALLVCALSSAAQAKSWRVGDFQDTIIVSEDGSAVVTERITLVFVGEWHGIHRTIPIEYPGPNGTNYELFLQVTSVTDGSGGKLKYDSSTSNGARDLKIYIPDAVDATRTVEIVYRVRNGTRFFDSIRRVLLERDRQRLAGTHRSRRGDCAFPREQPQDRCGRRRSPAYTARHSAMRPRQSTAPRRSSRPPIRLPMRGGLTIDVYIPKDVLKEPSALTKFFWFIGGNPIVFLPLVTLAGMFILWWYKGRDPDPGISVAPMYEPPVGISPAEAGTLLDD